jgi:hypothetical protein
VSIILGAELPEQVALAERHASQIAQLGGAITHDPTRFVEPAQLPSLEPPAAPGDVDSVPQHALEQEQRTIGRYGQLLDRVHGLDAVTERLVISILSDKVAREDDIESALSPASRPHLAGPRLAEAIEPPIQARAIGPRSDSKRRDLAISRISRVRTPTSCSVAHPSPPTPVNFRRQKSADRPL